MGFTAISAYEPDSVRFFAIQAMEDSLRINPKSDGRLPEHVELSVPPGKRADVTLTISSGGNQRQIRKDLRLGEPTYFKNLKSDPDDVGGMYDICFEASGSTRNDREKLHVITYALTTRTQEEIANYEENMKLQFQLEKEQRKEEYQKNHISPLQVKLNNINMLADSIATDWDYLERREERMRATSESTQSKVRTFSYVSITILIVSTIAQNIYLKTYFQKKKIM